MGKKMALEEEKGSQGHGFPQLQRLLMVGKLKTLVHISWSNHQSLLPLRFHVSLPDSCSVKTHPNSTKMQNIKMLKEEMEGE